MQQPDCRRLVELMGGEIAVDSTVGRGSTFWFTARAGRVAEVPRERRPAPASESEDRAPGRAVRPARTGRVLVVDDSSINRSVVLGMLSNLGYQATMASDGIEALATLADCAEGAFAAILLDCHMPGLDGFEVARRIRADETDGQHVPILALTADVLGSARERCMAAGMDGYMTKPLRLETLERMLTRWIPASTSPADSGSGVASGSGVPAAQPAEPTGAISASAISVLRRLQSPNMPDVVAELIDVFVTDTPLRLGRMRDAVATGDAAMLEQEAHTVKGNASHFGAAELVRACETLEGLARRGDLADADEHLAAVRRAYVSVEAALDALRGQTVA